MKQCSHIPSTCTTLNEYKHPDPVKSSTPTPVNYFGAAKTPLGKSSIHNYFCHIFKFKLQGDTYYLRDRDFLKNIPKIEFPRAA